MSPARAIKACKQAKSTFHHRRRKAPISAKQSMGQLQAPSKPNKRQAANLNLKFKPRPRMYLLHQNQIQANGARVTSSSPRRPKSSTWRKWLPPQEAKEIPSSCKALRPRNSSSSTATENELKLKAKLIQARQSNLPQTLKAKVQLSKSSRLLQMSKSKVSHASTVHLLRTLKAKVHLSRPSRLPQMSKSKKIHASTLHLPQTLKAKEHP